MSNQKMLDGKVIVVTGAGRGIGRAIAMLIADRGAKVVVNDLGGSASGEGADTGPAADVVEEITALGGEAVASFNSVAEWDTAHEIIQTAVDNFGRIDGVVNNAGILRDTIFHKMTEEQFDLVINVHLKGSFCMSRACAPHFREQKSGCLVHMTSTSGLIGNLGAVCLEPPVRQGSHRDSGTAGPCGKDQGNDAGENRAIGDSAFQ